MRITEADIWFLIPMAVGVAFMLWVIWQLAGQLRGRKREPGKEVDPWE
jgi:hypothetical protein